MNKIKEILKLKKFGSNHILYLICIIEIPFFLSLKVEDQLKYLPYSDRTLFRVREDLIHFKIINKVGMHDFVIDWNIIKKMI